MLKPILWGAGLALLSLTAHAQSVGAELASLREDVRLLTQKVGALTLQVEELQRDNEVLRKQTASSQSQAYATVAQLNEAVNSLNAAIKSGDTATAASASAQIKKLGDATNAALDSLAKGQATRPVVQTTFSDNFPAEGISYTVQKGDTLSEIARKTGAKLSDIINANKIADPTRVRVGDTLFIPGGK